MKNYPTNWQTEYWRSVHQRQHQMWHMIHKSLCTLTAIRHAVYGTLNHFKNFTKDALAQRFDLSRHTRLRELSLHVDAGIDAYSVTFAPLRLPETLETLVLHDHRRADRYEFASTDMCTWNMVFALRQLTYCCCAAAYLDLDFLRCLPNLVFLCIINAHPSHLRDKDAIGTLGQLQTLEIRFSTNVHPFVLNATLPVLRELRVPLLGGQPCLPRLEVFEGEVINIETRRALLKNRTCSESAPRFMRFNRENKKKMLNF